MNTFKLRNAVLVAAIASSLAACGGGDTPAAAAAAPFTGIVADGYVSGATVTLDTNDNGVCSDDTTTVQTGVNGDFSFTGQGPHMTCVTGGTDLATGQTLVGELRAPAPAAGTAALITPLTTLVVAQVQADKAAGVITTPAAAAATIATNLGLTGTDLLTANPVTASNNLTQTTAAVQTLLVQAAKSVVTSATGAAPTDAQTKSMYHSAAVGLAKAVRASAAVDMTTATAATVQTLVNTAIQNTVTAAKESLASVSTDATVVASKAELVAAFTAPANITALAPASVAAVAATTVASLTQDIATAPATSLASTTGLAGDVAATIAQASMNFVGTVQTIAVMLTEAVSTALGGTATTAPNAFTTIGQDVLDAIPASGVAADITTLNATIASAVAEANTAASGVISTLPAVEISAIVLTHPMVNGVMVNPTTNSVTVTGPLTSATISASISGTPTLPATTTAGIGATEVGGGNRVLKLLIDQVQVICGTVSAPTTPTTCSTSSVITVTVPATAKLYAYGKNSAGTEYSAVLTNVASNVLTSSNGLVSVDWSAALTALQAQSGFANLSLVTGTFDVGVGLSNVPLNKYPAGTPADPISGYVPAAYATAAGFPNGGVFSGQGAAIRVTVQ